MVSIKELYCDARPTKSQDLYFMLPSQKPTYIVPRLRTSDVDVIFDLRLMVTLGATDINERYKILKVDLSEDNADVFLRLQMLGNTSLNVSLPNWGLTLATKDNILSSYLICRGVSESGEPHILFEHAPL